MTDSASKTRYWLVIAAQVVVALAGIYLMLAPAIWNYGSPAAAVERFIGPVIASFALIAAWECTRNVRWLNVILALILVILALSPVPGDYPTRAIVSDVIVAVIVIGLTCLPFPRRTHYGGGWSRVFLRRA